ncbi:MAG: putative Ig domain proteni [Gammaproteobacteria bacterium]|jgi:hypothetical protein|nr:putative Ig domain proteni [Gammaproteobacteria bacterium]
MPTYQQQNKSVLNLFASLIQWVLNNPLQAIVAMLALQAMNGVNATEDKFIRTKSRNLARSIGSAEAIDSDVDFRGIASAILTNNHTVIAWSQNPSSQSHTVNFKVYDAANTLVVGPMTASTKSGSESMLDYNLGAIVALDNNDFGLFYTTDSTYNYRRYGYNGVEKSPEAVISSKGNRYNAVMGMAKMSNGNLVSISYSDHCGGDDATLTTFNSNGGILTQTNCFINSGPLGSARVYSLANQRYLVHYAQNNGGGAVALKFRVYDENTNTIVASRDVDQSGYFLRLYAGGPSSATPLTNNNIAFGWTCDTAYKTCVKCFDASYNQIGSIQSYSQSTSSSPIAMLPLSDNGFLAGWCEGTDSDYVLTIRRFDASCNFISRIPTTIKPKLLGAGAAPLYGTFRIKDVVNAPDQFEVLWSDNSLVLRQKFSLTDGPVTLLNPIPNQTIRSRIYYTYQIPSNTFTYDSLDSSINYVVTKSDGNTLPAWLEYDAPTTTLRGAPEDSDIAYLAIKVLGYNNGGSNATSTFNLNIKRYNRAPVAALPLPNRSAKVGLPFSTTISGSAFTDADGDVISYNATRPDNSTLPAWLSLNNSTRQFTGTPPSAGSLGVKVKAYDDYDGEVFSQFTINIAESLAATIPSSGAYIQNQGYSFSGFSINSEASSSVTLKLTLSDSEAGSLSTPSSGAAVSSYNAATGVWTVTGTSAEVQSIANQVQFVPVNGYSDPLVISALVDDGVNTPVSNNLSLTSQAPSASATATATTTNTPSATGTAIPTATVTGSPSTTASAAGTASAAPTPLGTATAQPSFNAQVPVSPSPMVEASASASPSRQANASPSPNLDTSNTGTNDTGGMSSSMITSIAGSVGGAVAAGLIGLMFRQYSASKEAAKFREEHPFANYLRSELKLNIEDFKAKRGVEYLNTVKLLNKEFEKFGLDVAHFTNEEIHILAPIVADAIRARLALNSNCSGKTMIPSMLALKNALADIAKESTAKYRAKTAQTFGTATPLYSNPIGGAANDPRASRVYVAGSMV